MTAYRLDDIVQPVELTRIFWICSAQLSSLGCGGSSFHLAMTDREKNGGEKKFHDSGPNTRLTADIRTIYTAGLGLIAGRL